MKSSNESLHQNFTKAILSDSDVSILDAVDAVLPETQQRVVENASGTIATDVENVMDNWFISSREWEAQRTSSDVAEKRAWEARKNLASEPENLRDAWWLALRKSTVVEYVAKLLSSQERNIAAEGFAEDLDN